MSREYEVFVESLRQSLMERLGLNEKQIYFEERDENGMTPNGDRLFVECNASSVRKEVCGSILYGKRGCKEDFKRKDIR